MSTATFNTSWPVGCDLYFQWATLTGFRYLDGIGPNSDHSKVDPDIQVLVECRGALRDDLFETARKYLLRPFETEVTAHVLFDDEGSKTAVFSVTAPISQVEKWKVSFPSDLLRLELSSARQAPGMDKILEGFIVPDIPAPKKIRDQVVIAVIDDGLPFLHERFLVKGQRQMTRVQYFWDQTPDDTAYPKARLSGLGLASELSLSKRYWEPVYRFGYGRELSPDIIQSLIVDPRSELEKYRALQYKRVYPDQTHGSHVADLAAGDIGENIPVIMVQLPGPVVQDTSGGGTAKHVADAIVYILDRVSEYTSVVINLSFGTNAGPHDGSTLIERVMDGISLEQQKTRRFLIVLPAGNALNSQGHGQLTLTEDRSQELIWNVRFDDPTESFCEIWWPTTRWEDLKIELVDPSGSSLTWTSKSPSETSSNDGSDIVFAVLGTPRSSAANEKAEVLIALSPTKAQEGSPRVHPGLWRLKLSNIGTDDFTVDAWIQRDDSPMNTRQSARQSFFLSTRGTLRSDEDDVPSDPVKRLGTGNSLAHGRKTIVVGGAVQADWSLASYTAAGMSNTAWPDIIAPSDEAATQPGLPAAGTRSNSSFRMNGTSVAAPQIARWIAQLWQQGLSEKDKDGILAQLSKAPEPPNSSQTNLQKARSAAGKRRPK